MTVVARQVGERIQLRDVDADDPEAWIVSDTVSEVTQ